MNWHTYALHSPYTNNYYMKNIIQLHEANNVRIINESKDKVHPRRGHEGPEGSKEVQLCSFFNFNNKWRWVFNATPKPLYPQERDLVLLVQ